MKKSILFIFALFISLHIYAQNDKGLESMIVKKWMDYSKAFEYKDYDRIANHFTYPAVTNFATPLIVENKNSMIELYKSDRENLQDDYKYSLLEDWKLLNISDNLIILDAYYSRYNDKYELIISGRGLYTYKNINGLWLLSEIISISN